MIISHSKKFIFFKSRKTAGSSIQHVMAAFCSPDDYISGCKINQNLEILPNVKGEGKRTHVPAYKVQSYLDPHVWRDCFKFTFIRNPWDLAVSRWLFNTGKGRCPEMDFQAWLTYTSEKIWKKDELTQYTHINGELAVDFVGRFETLTNDINTVLTKLGGKNLVLGHKNKCHVPRTHYSTYYNQAAIDFVANKQKRAIDMYNYTFDRA